MLRTKQIREKQHQKNHMHLVLSRRLVSSVQYPNFTRPEYKTDLKAKPYTILLTNDLQNFNFEKM